MDSANRTRRVYEAKTLFLGKAGEGERRGLLILKPVLLRNFGCCGWPSIATKNVKKKCCSRNCPPKDFSVKLRLIFWVLWCWQGLFKCGTAVGGDCCPTRRLESQMYHHCGCFLSCWLLTNEIYAAIIFLLHPTSWQNPNCILNELGCFSAASYDCYQTPPR